MLHIQFLSCASMTASRDNGRCKLLGVLMIIGPKNVGVLNTSILPISRNIGGAVASPVPTLLQANAKHTQHKCFALLIPRNLTANRD